MNIENCSVDQTYQKVDISVIIVNWNTKNYLLNCLNSLDGSNRRKNIEIIVVDNGSKDGSIEEVENNFPKVKIFKNENNKGFAVANNIGMKNSKGRYICLINSDIKVLGNCLERLCDYMDSHPTIGMIGPKILNPDMTLQCSCRSFPTLWNNICAAVGLNRIFKGVKFFSSEQMFFFKHDLVCCVNVLAGCFLMVRREALMQVGPFDERFFMYAEDIDWCKRFWKMGWEVVFYPETKVIHYRGKSSSNAPIQFAKEQDRAILQYWAKYHQVQAQMAILLILTLKHIFRIGALIFLLFILPSKKTDNLQKIKKHFACLLSLFSSWKACQSTIN